MATPTPDLTPQLFCCGIYNAAAAVWSSSDVFDFMTPLCKRLNNPLSMEKWTSKYASPCIFSPTRWDATPTLDALTVPCAGHGSLMRLISPPPHPPCASEALFARNALSPPLPTRSHCSYKIQRKYLLEISSTAWGILSLQREVPASAVTHTALGTSLSVISCAVAELPLGASLHLYAKRV